MSDPTPIFQQQTINLDNSTLNGYGFGKRKVALIGDSITAGANSYTTGANTTIGGVDDNEAPGTWAMLQSQNGSWDLVQQAGVSGQTSTQILSRIHTEVINIGAEICVIWSCTMNDIGQGLSLATSLSNITQMITALLNAGILPILALPTPAQVSETAANIGLISQRRANYIAIARNFNIPIIDPFPTLGNYATGTMASAYNAGDVHPNYAGRKVEGQLIANLLDKICFGNGASGVVYQGDTTDLLNGIGFMNGTASAGVAGGWSATPITGATLSIFNDSVLGNMQRTVTSATSANQYYTANLNNLNPLHTYEITGFISKTGTSDAQISINPATGNRRITIQGSGPDITKGWVRCRWTPGYNNTSATYYLVVGAGTGTVDFSHLAVRDLTALGIN